MIYTLDELLMKLGAPEVAERKNMSWHYFVPRKEHLAGHASVRLEADGEYLVAEMHHVREDVMDDDGEIHVSKTESFYLYAERTARPGHYRINELAFDGDAYPKPSKSVAELALSIFHARALDISIRMVEQEFNKQDIMNPKDEAPQRRPALGASFVQRALQEKAMREIEQQNTSKNSNVVMFRPRRPYAAANI
jgi:hypothetical protein